MTAKFTTFVTGCLLAGGAVFAAAATPAPAEPGLSHEAENAVVKVFSTLVHPDLARPWAKAPPQEATGTGVVIEGKRILTNAHVVQYASQVQVAGQPVRRQALGDGRRHRARASTWRC